ncbi:MAG: sensor histidine kinase, partial [Bacillota bacterium]
VKEVLEDTRPVFKNYAVKPSLEGDTATIEGDREKLTLALSNLMSNAARHTEKGGTVTMHVEPFKNQVALTMINTPAAMDDAIMHAFDEQNTLKEATKKEGGVGLHIVRLVLDQHKAEASFENLEDEVRFIARFKSAE